MLLLEFNKKPHGAEPLFGEAFEERFWAKVDIRDPNQCWPWKASIGSKGLYGHMWCIIDGKKTCRDAHTIVWMIANGLIPKGRDVMHRCNSKLCCNPAHLLVGSRSENIKMALRDGLLRTKLSPHKARLIVGARRRGKLVIEIAGRYKVKAIDVLAILRGQRWSALTQILPRQIIAPLAEQLVFVL